MKRDREKLEAETEQQQQELERIVKDEQDAMEMYVEY